jgi:hypothetical protein
MTSTNDFDRALGGWLEEGPNSAPDRSIELAVEHARAHPRRRDPLGFVRPDPMARRSTGFALRPVLVLAVLGLLLAAVAGLGVGGRRDQGVVIPPPPSTTPAPASPSSSPVSPSPMPSASTTQYLVELTVAAGQPQTVTVIDGSGLLAEATSGTPSGDGQSFPFDAVEVSNLDPTTLQLGWAGFPCQTDHTLRIDSNGRTMTLERPACAGETDSIGLDRILVLRFSKAVAASDVKVSLVP